MSVEFDEEKITYSQKNFASSHKISFVNALIKIGVAKDILQANRILAGMALFILLISFIIIYINFFSISFAQQKPRPHNLERIKKINESRKQQSASINNFSI